MKRTMSVMGFLGSDPEVKTTKNGTSYTTFRLANTAYGDAEGQTTWFTVTVWDATKQKLCQTLKKGSCVEVEGDYSDRTYTSNKTGQTEVGRDIIANSIYFGPSRREEDNNSNGNVVQKTTTATSTPKEVVKTMPVTNTGTSEISTGEDELPF